MTCRSTFFFLFCLLVVIGLDQVVKYWVMNNILLGTAIPILPFLSLYHVHNYGIAFSFFSSFSHWGLIALTLTVIVFLLWIRKNTDHDKILSRFGLTLIIGGAFGNFIDRIRFHYVIDYILFYIDDIFYFAVFNLADTFITLGAITIIIEELHIWIKKKYHSHNTL
ncbi:signal peptidase II [Bartonella sp. CB189]|uniref:signal peptidase II n=1 Tax=Bartonella sp. CB189 TaxID=3112254 RepID=UPI002F96DD50